MLIIGHRGAQGLAPENTLESFAAAAGSGVDMIEFDVRLTRDKVPVVIHDSNLRRTHDNPAVIKQLTLGQLQSITKDSPLPTLEQVLDIYFGKILLNIELKNRGSAKVILEQLKKRAGNSQVKWDNLLVSSFRAHELITLRRLEPRINLAMLHDNNPFGFIAYQRYLQLTAVGFHRLHTNRLAIEIAKKAGLFTYVYTVDRPKSATRFARAGYDAVVTNYPDRVASELRRH